MAESQRMMLNVGRMKTVSDGAALDSGWENVPKEKTLS